ncbi:MAG: Ig-like domain-containing protein [Hydrococcus sp. CRU_1_1]|nr:Ig-like domain-containing protein [Hydrococcus sp. CRU_1_1]
MLKSLQPIDRISLTLILIFSLAIGGLVWGGTACGTACFVRTGPRIREFSWQNKQVGAEDKAFIMTFDRPMDRKEVEKNLEISPPLSGKISWAGRRLAYTLDTPVPYGESYEVTLKDAREHFRAKAEAGQVMQPFSGQFHSRDRAFAYIGTLGHEQGRLIINNLTQNKKALLTPSDLVVMDFKFYPKGDRILFSAAPRSLGDRGLRELQLYQISTQLPENGSESSQKAELILDNKDYQNNQFDLSSDGETIVVQRVNRKNPADFDLWMVRSGTEPKRLNTSGGEFLIAPDGQTIAVAQGQGIGILPLKPGAEAIDFLPKFGKILSFSRDGSAAAMVNFNMDNAKLRYTRSLFYVNNQGVQKELLGIQGSILDCQFNATDTHLYCLLTQLLDGEEYQEKPYFARINIETAKVTPLLALPDFRDIKVSLAPDGLAILFDQIVRGNSANSAAPLTTSSGEPIREGRLWLLVPPPDDAPSGTKPQLEELPLQGFRPQWQP